MLCRPVWQPTCRVRIHNLYAYPISWTLWGPRTPRGPSVFAVHMAWAAGGGGGGGGAAALPGECIGLVIQGTCTMPRINMPIASGPSAAAHRHTRGPGCQLQSGCGAPFPVVLRYRTTPRTPRRTGLHRCAHAGPWTQAQAAALSRRAMAPAPLLVWMPHPFPDKLNDTRPGESAPRFVWRTSGKVRGLEKGLPAPAPQHPHLGANSGLPSSSKYPAVMKHRYMGHTCPLT